MVMQNLISRYLKFSSDEVVSGPRLARAVRNQFFGAVPEKASENLADRRRDYCRAITSGSVERQFSFWGGGRIK